MARKDDMEKYAKKRLKKINKPKIWSGPINDPYKRALDRKKTNKLFAKASRF